MRRGATREEIIRTTQDLIARNGIRAVRVDEIAQTLGISKRTLYEMFADKTDLVAVCLVDMRRRQQEQIGEYRKAASTETPLRQAGEFIHKYIDGLNSVDSSFLKEVQHRLDFSELIDEHRTFCHEELARILTDCREAGLLLPGIDPRNLSDRILDTVLEQRLNKAANEEMVLFCRTMLRGTATRAGIEMIDQHS